MTTAVALGAGSGLPTMHQPRVLSSNKASTKQRKNEVKAMIASVQNTGAQSSARSETTPSPTPSSKASPSLRMLKAHVKDETLLKVKIKSAIEKGKFYVPVSLLVDRELEMRKSAKDFSIRATRWNKSRLFREWRNQLQEDIHNNEQQPRTEIQITLDPEEDCKSTNQSHSFEWKPWLTTCIRAYYNTGTIRIPDECIGSDILLALEYFGILYSPDQLVFDSFGGYLRVKLWSDYFTHRAKMADWVVQKLVTTPSRHSHCFVTCPNMQDEDFHFVGSNKHIVVLDGDLDLDKARYGSTPSRAVVHEFFNDEEEESKMDCLMRADFCAFVQASLPGTNVSFSLKPVTSTSSKEPVERAVMRINLVPKPSPEGGPKLETNGVVQSQFANPMGHQVPNVETGTTPQSASQVSSLTAQSAAHVSGSTPQSAVHADAAENASGTTPQSAFLLPNSSADSKTEIARAIVMRRSKTDEKKKQLSALDRSFEDRPHDEYTPTSSPRKQLLNTSWGEDPSIDYPRETLQDSAEFARSLSRKIIRQTLVDMDTTDSGLKRTLSGTPSGASLRPASETPFDECGPNGAGGNDPHLTEDDIQKCMLPSLPSFELDKDHSGRPPTKTSLPFYPKEQPPYKAPMKKLEVIGQITTPQSTPKALSPPNTAEKPAPVPHIDVENVEPSDGSVMSALSNPFDDPTVQNSLDALDARRPQSTTMEVLGGFRTPVDALSLADDKSVRIENQEEEDDEEQDEDDDDDEEEVEVDEEEEPPRRQNRSPRSRRSPRKEYVDPDDESQTGCVSNFLNVLCSPLTGGEVTNKKERPERRERKEYSDDDTPDTHSETDEDDEDPSGDRQRKSSHRQRKPSQRKSSDELTGQEMINEIGGMADTMVEGIAASFSSMFGSASEPKRRSSPKKTAREQYTSDSDDDEDESTYQSTIDDLEELVVDETTVEEAGVEGEIVRIIPRPRERPVGKHDRPPLPMKNRPPRQASPRAGKENSLERIQEILRSKDTSHHSTTRLSANVKRNLELLQAADAPAANDFGHIGRISVLDSSNDSRQRGKAGSKVQDKKRDNKKGLLGFLRKK